MSKASSISSGDNNTISSSSYRSSVIGGCSNYISTSFDSVIIGGSNLQLNNVCSLVYVPELKIATASICNTSKMILTRDDDGMVRYRDLDSIIYNDTVNNNWSIGVCQLTMQSGTNSIIIGGTKNGVFNNNYNITSGSDNIVISPGQQSCAINSQKSVIVSNSSSGIFSSTGSSIFGGYQNSVSCSVLSSVVAGCGSQIISSSRSTIIGSVGTTFSNSTNSVIIGGQNLTLSGVSDTVLVPNLLISGSMSPNCGTNFGITDNIVISGSASLCFVNGILVSVGP
jgi:hypothetical protein